VRERGDRLLRLRRDLGGEWFLDPRVLVIVVPTATLASVAARAGPGLGSALGWTLANIGAFMVCTVLVLVMVKATRRRRRIAPLPITVTVVAGALLGTAKVVLTDAFGALLGLTSVAEASLGERIVQVSVVGVGMVPLLVVLKATLVRHRTEHRLLVAETFAGILDQADPNESGAEARLEVASVIGELRAVISGASASAAAALLTDAVELRLRPLTHRLWAGSPAPSSDLTLRGLLVAMLRRPVYPVVVPTLTHLAVVTLHALDSAEPARAVLTGAAAAVALGAILQLGRLSRPQGGRHVPGLAHLGLVVTAAAATATLVVAGMLRPGLTMPVGALVLVMLAWIVPLVLVAGVVATASHDRDAVRAHLALLLGPQWYSRLSRAHVDGAAARDIADRLHGDLQGALLAAAARLHRLPVAGEDARTEIARVDALLARAIDARTVTPSVPVGTQLAELGVRWRGFLDVRFTFGAQHGAAPVGASATFGARADRLIAGIVSESLTNAYRHGRARQVDATFEIANGRVTITIDDDGAGPLDGRQGIGSSHLDAVAPGAWSRRAREGGGTRLEVALQAGASAVALVPHFGRAP
jgi:signal transduction histidine kinase